jgi:hypothetical protein
MTQSRLDSSTVRSNTGRYDDTPGHDFGQDDDGDEQRAASERAEAERSEARDDEPRVRETPLGTSYLGDGKSDESWQRWRQIQGDFVDDPRNSVAEAHALVSELIDGIVQRFEGEREQLEQRWSQGEDVSTDDLRLCLQRYRDFFGRLLSNLEAR